MSEKLSLRQSYVDALIRAGEARDDFVVLEADATGSTFVGQFCERFPERHVRCGIAEQNMIGVAAGLSRTGTIPVANTMAVFVTLRALEQLRTSVCFPGFNVKLVASHVGIDVGEDGPTQAAIEDAAVMRSLPGLMMLSPADDLEMDWAVRTMLEHDGPVYLRTGRSPVPRVHAEDTRFALGVWPELRPGRDVTLVGVGIMVHIALQAAELLSTRGISARVLNASTIKPAAEETLIRTLAQTGAVVTAEDHNWIGGVGSLVSEIVGQYGPMPVERIGLRDCFAESGNASALFEKYGLTAQGIAAAAERAVERKR